MSIMKKLLATVGMIAVFAAGTFAQYPGKVEARNNKTYQDDRFERGRGSWSNSTTSQINFRQREIRENIANGIIRGTLTSNEVHMLLDMAEKIEMKENRFLRNGRLTNMEMRELENDLNRLERMIIHNKRDKDFAPVDQRPHHKKY